MSIVIRAMQETDNRLWAEMRFALWDSLTVEEHLDDIDRMLKGVKCRGYIASLPDGTPAGFAEISIRGYANGCTSKPVPFLEGIWIHGDHRRQGIGKALVEKITSDLVNEGYHELCSDAEIDNAPSHKAHEHWGFSETQRVVYFRKALI